MKRLLTVLLTTAILPFSNTLALHAQDDTFGLDFSLSAEKKIKRGLDFSVEGGVRTQDDTRKIDRWTVGAALGMKLYNSTTFDVKAGAKWEYLWVNNLAETTLKYDPKLIEIGPPPVYEYEYKGYKKKAAYWRNRHRSSLSLAANYQPNKQWDFTLKEIVQYTHFCEASTTVDKYRLNDDEDIYLKETSTKDYRPKDRFILRSRFTTQYNTRHCPFDPYASVEYGCGLNYTTNKWKYTAGTDIKLNKQHKFTLFYRYQTEDDDDEPNGHLIGAGYSFKF